MKKHRLSRTLAAAISAQMLLASCSATAHGPLWPERKPLPVGDASLRMAPDFQAPSATHCARPVAMREVPGRPAQQEQRHGAWPEGSARGEAADMAKAETRERGAPAAAASRAIPPPAPAPAIAESAAAPSLQRRDHGPSDAPPQSQPQRHQGPVTAGVVDDNADFDAYLAFRDRTQVAHRPRDVRQRYLLEVKDARGRGVGDAEVAVRSPAGHGAGGVDQEDQVEPRLPWRRRRVEPHFDGAALATREAASAFAAVLAHDDVVVPRAGRIERIGMQPRPAGAVGARPHRMAGRGAHGHLGVAHAAAARVLHFEQVALAHVARPRRG
ncbi:MAG: hypothetical protein EOO24_28370, partial [Comamonadaceae bacterium]